MPEKDYSRWEPVSHPQKDYSRWEPVNHQVQESPGLLKQAAQVGGGLLNAATQAITKPAEWVNDVSGNRGFSEGKKPGYVKPSVHIEKNIESVLGEGSTKANNILTKGLQYTASNWPLLLFGGVPTAGKVAADVAGSTALAAAEKVTNNPIVGIGAHILGQKGFKDASNYFKKAPKEVGKLTNYISSLYEGRNKVGSKISANSKIIKSDLKNLKSEVNKSYTSDKFNGTAQSELIKNIERAEKVLKKRGLTAADLAKEKIRLNQLYTSKKSIEGQFNNKLIDAFKNELNDISKKHPEFGKLYKASDELHSIGQWQKGLTDALEKYSSKGLLEKIVPNPVAQGAIWGLATGLKGNATGLGAAAAVPLIKGAGVNIAKAGIGTGRAAKFTQSLMKSNEGRKLLMELVADSAKENSSAIAKNLRKLNIMADKYEEDI